MARFFEEIMEKSPRLHTIKQNMAICNTALDLYEVQNGYYACENQEQIADWLAQRPAFSSDIHKKFHRHSYVSSMVTYERGVFNVYFLVHEVILGEPCLWLLYVPNFLSKHFDLLCFNSQYPDLDVAELFYSMSRQFTKLTEQHGHPLPVSGCRHKAFTGFMYDVDTMFSLN